MHVIEGPHDAPVVMLAHGVLTSHRMWDGVATLLRSRWRVLRYDLRGHGGAAVPPPPYTMADLADDAVALLDRLGIDRVHFVGSSLGGMFGQRLGALHGSRLLSLTLANTTAVQPAPTVWQQRIDAARAHGVVPLVEPTLQRWFTAPFLAAGGETVECMRQLAMSTPVDGFVGCATAIRDLDHAGLLGDIAVPTLVIAGASDQATLPAEGSFIHRRIARSHLATLPAAHQCAAECPQAFVAAWQSFVH